MARRASAPEKFTYDASMRIVVLHGKEPYLVTARTREIADALRQAHGEIEQFEFDGETAELADVLDELRSYGLIQRHKLVILDKAEQFLAANDRRRPAMEAYAESPVDSATLLMRSEAWRAGKLDKLIKKVGAIHKIEPPDDANAMNWCVRRCKKEYDATIDADAAATLVELIGPQLARLDVELAKLAAFVGSGGQIQRQHVIELVGMSREEKVWAIQTAMASGNTAHALTKLRELLGPNNEQETLVVWAICDVLRKLHAAAHLLRKGVNGFAITKQLKLWGDSQQPILSAAKRCEPASLAHLLNAAIQMDVNNKSGTGDPTRSLEALTVQIADVLAGKAAAR